MSKIMTLLLEDEVGARRRKLPGTTRLGKPFLASGAICEIKAALKEANAGDFADDTEVAALASKWSVDMDDCLRTAQKNRA